MLMNMNLVAAALELVLPAGCAGCGDTDRRCSDGLCTPCRHALAAAVPVSWQLFGPAGEVLPAFAAASYDGVVRSVLLEYKEHARLGLRHGLATCLLLSVIAALGADATVASIAAAGNRRRSVLLVPVPSAAATRRARGHDPVGALARIVVRQLRACAMAVDACSPLRQSRPVADQSGLDVVARRANLAGAIEVPKPATVRGRRVIVVDDIVTTGVTALEAARALTAAGATVSAVAAVAATVRRFPRSPPAPEPIDGSRPAGPMRPVVLVRGPPGSD
jgi:predicted amidophosphoribosyltransferase